MNNMMILIISRADDGNADEGDDDTEEREYVLRVRVRVKEWDLWERELKGSRDERSSL